MSEIRPDPDDLLKICDEEQKNRGAKLRVFLGMSAGVGKTYAMLRAVHQRQKEGIDVVIGVVETHGRSETSELLQGLTLTPRKKIEYRGAQLEEMDLEAILARKPQLVVVDELAHTNVVGSRHEKRYQDVIELLDAGIDVYTALNVQHLESRKDAVEAITGVSIRETVPDSILERASLVELVDIAPTELLKRLKEGKIYLGDRAERAEQNFFKEDKLTALREISLRMTAERVDQDLQRFVNIRQDGSPWEASERLLVAVSHSPYSEKLIRATRRLAYNLEAPWIAVHVNNGITLGDEDQAQLVKNLNLARELKAEVITTTEVNVPAAIKRLCQQKNVTQVIVGRPTRRRFRDILEGGRLLDHLVEGSVDVGVIVVRPDKKESTPRRPSLASELAYYRSNTGFLKYWYTLCFLIMISLFSGFIQSYIGYRAVGFVFLLAVLVIGMVGSIGAVIFAATFSGLVWDYFFIPPRMTFAISTADDFLMCVAFFVVALITGFLTNRIRFHERVIREREDRTNVLYEILRDISNSKDKSEFLTKVTSRVGSLLQADCGVILKSPQGGDLKFPNSSTYGFKLSEKDQAVALWCFQNDKSAGWSTDTLSQANALFIPLKGQSERMGVFVFQPKNKGRKLDMEKENLLFSVVRQLGTSVERHFLTKRLGEAQRLKDSEELHQTLLNSISHEMRTPLTAILGSASALEDEKIVVDPKAVKGIAHNLQQAGERLNRVIENLLDMSRLNSGVLSLKLEWHDINDLLGVVSRKLEKPLESHPFQIQFDEHSPLIKIDFRLMEHALSNLILNATMYTPPGTPIKVLIRHSSDLMMIEINDEGGGIPEASRGQIFDKFYRVPGSPPGGTGLGLSIVKSIVELHKGEISVENLTPHGASFKIELPIGIQPETPTENSGQEN